MLDTMRRLAPTACEAEVHEALFLARSRGPGKSGHAQGEVGVGPLERAFCHRARNDFRYRVILVEDVARDTEQVGLCLLRIDDEAAIEPVSRTLDIGQERGEHAAGAAFRSRDL